MRLGKGTLKVVLGLSKDIRCLPATGLDLERVLRGLMFGQYLPAKFATAPSAVDTPSALALVRLGAADAPVADTITKN